jgi:hypothetical protein
VWGGTGEAADGRLRDGQIDHPAGEPVAGGMTAGTLASWISRSVPAVIGNALSMSSATGTVSSALGLSG